MAYDIVAQESSGSTVTSPAEVAIWVKMVDDSVIYTVPTGKMFRGWVVARDGSSNCDYTYTPGSVATGAFAKMGNNGAALNSTFYSRSTGDMGQWPINMNAGDALKRRSSHDRTLMGIETAINTVSWDTGS